MNKATKMLIETTKEEIATVEFYRQNKGGQRVAVTSSLVAATPGILNWLKLFLRDLEDTLQPAADKHLATFLTTPEQDSKKLEEVYNLMEEWPQLVGLSQAKTLKAEIERLQDVLQAHVLRTDQGGESHE